MDILTHTLSGVAVGTVVATLSKSGFKYKALIILIAGIAGALPDIDVISFWSGFDRTFGEFFNLKQPGKEIYFSKHWYGHHGFMHSIVADLIFSTIIGLILFKLKKNLKYLSEKDIKLTTVAFFFGFLVHLFEDMPTPSATWGGINFLFPSKEYTGGFGNIWWWNNYDIFLIVCSVIFINTIVHFFSTQLKQLYVKIPFFVFFLGTVLAIYQIKTRPYDFSYKLPSNKYSILEAKSKEIQKEILGKRMYSIMEKFDNSIKLNF